MKKKWLIGGIVLTIFVLVWANRTTLAFLVVPLFLDSEESSLPNAALTSSGVIRASAFKTYKNAVVPSQ